MGKAPEIARTLFVTEDQFDFVHRIKNEFGFNNIDALDELTGLLVGYVSRDQSEENDEAEWAARRKRGYALAKAMKANAQQAMAAIAAAREAVLEFNEVIQFSPPLLEQIFDIDTGRPDNFFMPPDIDVLLNFLPSEEHLGAILGDLAELATLPIHNELKRGPVANLTLRKAVQDCRTFWRDVEHRSWTMSRLNDKVTRNDAYQWLQGNCEKFVVTMLNETGFRFTLKDLYNAWLAINTQKPAAER